MIPNFPKNFPSKTGVTVHVGKVPPIFKRAVEELMCNQEITMPHENEIVTDPAEAAMFKELLISQLKGVLETVERINLNKESGLEHINNALKAVDTNLGRRWQHLRNMRRETERLEDLQAQVTGRTITRDLTSLKAAAHVSDDPEAIADETSD